MSTDHIQEDNGHSTHRLEKLKDKLTVVDVDTKFPTFCGTQTFITVLTKARQWSLP